MRHESLGKQAFCPMRISEIFDGAMKPAPGINRRSVAERRSIYLAQIAERL